MLRLGIRIWWGDAVVSDQWLRPPRDFWLGEQDADFALVCPRTRLVHISGDTIHVDLGDSTVELTAGGSVTRQLGEMRIEVSLEPEPRRRFGRGRDLSIVPYLAAAGVLGAALLAYGALSPEPSEAELREDQLYLIQHYLAASTEREIERDDIAETPSHSVRGIEGGRGGSFAVRGPIDAHARQASLREVSEFGMIGLLSAGASSVGDAPAMGARTVDDVMQAGDPFGDALDPQGGEEYADHGVNPPIETAKDPLSTFAVDVDTGSYAIARRKLDNGSLPPLASVRAEEFINAFEYAYAGPESSGGQDAFSVHLDAAPSPFDAGHHLVRVAVQGRRVPTRDRPPVHLVYLVDTSGSMMSDDKLGLAKQSLRLLTGVLRRGDTVALQTYAGSVREVLPPTDAAREREILDAIDGLHAGGSTAMASGIDNAYRMATRTHVAGEISRVIVLSDGDTNVGPVSSEELLEIIGRYKQHGITLSTVGFGMGNYKDAMMERLADAGDGNYSYVGDLNDAKRVFVAQAGALLQVIARDVKIQVEFDPAMVRRYRLIGYENRDVADRDFRDDRVDGGEIGAGHAVTAIYDVELAGTRGSPLAVRLRHKHPLAGHAAQEIAVLMGPESIAQSFSQADPDFRFAAALAGFAEVMRGSPYALDWRLPEIEQLASEATEGRPERRELVKLVRVASELSRTLASSAP